MSNLGILSLGSAQHLGNAYAPHITAGSFGNGSVNAGPLSAGGVLAINEPLITVAAGYVSGTPYAAWRSSAARR